MWYLIVILLIVWVFSGFGIFMIMGVAESTLLESIYSFQNITECTNLKGTWDQTCLEAREITNQVIQILKLVFTVFGPLILVKIVYRKLQ